MKTKAKIRAVRALAFSFFGFFMLGIISIINSGAAYATTSSVAASSRHEELLGVNNNAFEFSRPSKINKIIDINDSYVFVGKEYYSRGEENKFAPTIMRYVDSDYDGQYELAWHQADQSYPGEFYDVAYDYRNNIIYAVGKFNNGGMICVFDLNGNLLSRYTTTDESSFNFIGTDDSSYSFHIASSRKEYALSYDTSTSSISVASTNTSYDSDLIYFDYYTAATKNKIYRTSNNTSWVVEGDFVAVQSSPANWFNARVFAIEGDSTIKMFNGESGTLEYEYTVPNAKLSKLYQVSPNTFDSIYALGKDNTDCGIGGAYERDTLYKVSKGSLSNPEGLQWKKSIYNVSRSASATRRYYDDITVFGSNKLLISGSLYDTTSAQRVQNTTWYVQGDEFDVNYVLTSADNPNITNCPTVVEAQTALTPRTPSATGFTFTGWYTDQGLTNKFTNGTRITSDTTLYGKWDRNVYNVTFSWSNIYPSGATLPATQNVAYESTATQPSVGSYAGYNWSGWHLSSCANPEYDFNTPVTGNLNIVGCWGQNQNTVSFEVVSTDNPSSYSPSDAFRSKTVNYGETVSLPSPTTNNGKYVFDGWYTDRELTNVYDSTQPVTASMTLYGAWVNQMVTVQDGENGIEIANPTIAGDGAYIDENGNLVLDNFSGYGIDINTSEDINVVVKNENVVGQGGISTDNDLTLEGDGTLTVDGLSGIGSAGNLTIKDITVDASIIGASNDVVIDNADVTSDAIMSTGEGSVLIKDSKITSTADDGTEIGSIIAINGDITIDNSEVATSALIAQNHNINIINDSQVLLSNTSNSEGAGISTQKINVKDSSLDINVANSDSIMINEGILQDGGKVNIKADLGNFAFPVLWVQSGDFGISSSEPGAFVLNNLLTQIDDGTLAIKGPAVSCSLVTPFAAFNGGVTNIDNSGDPGVAAVCVNLAGAELGDRLNLDSEAIPDFIANIKNTLGIELTQGEHIVFNGGDTTLKAKMASVLVITNNEESAKDTIKTTSNMIVDPTGTKLGGVGEGVGSDAIYFYGFTNGKEVAFDEDTGLPVNFANAVHIYPYVPVPATDEEVPNTLDFQILGIAGAVFISLMLEGMIIADLYRRLHGYEEEIALETAAENAVFSNQPVQPTQAQTEEKPAKIIEDIKPIKKEISVNDSQAESISVKINNHHNEDHDYYNGPGDEYYY